MGENDQIKVKSRWCVFRPMGEKHTNLNEKYRCEKQALFRHTAYSLGRERK